MEFGCESIRALPADLLADVTVKVIGDSDGGAGALLKLEPGRWRRRWK